MRFHLREALLRYMDGFSLFYLELRSWDGLNYKYAPSIPPEY